MVNEIISWAKKKNESLFIFKVDFEKAFDLLDWKFLDNIMRQMGFSTKWRSWIQGCLNSAYSSVIVNGSPTKEFKIQKGLRLGDPLSPFLFIIAIEALYVTFQEAKSKNLFHGIKVGSIGVDVSLLQFADDALILGVISFGGSLELNKMAWISWKKICSSPNCGGLGVGSLYASNLAMLEAPICLASKPSPWKNIMNLNTHFLSANINLLATFTRKVGNGKSISFWNDVWTGSSSLKSLFPRLFALETSAYCCIADRCN
ncbi:RNA-directed DNA polymerase, eukaryota, reverse transcriptase zinc-binding domain protein, partial [Tanacetum coccineum]